MPFALSLSARALLFALLPAVGVSCSVYDDELLHDAASLDRVSTLDGGRGGAGGSGPSTTGDAGQAGESAGLCAGMLHEGRCWYLGGANASCRDTCEDRGGCDPDAPSVVGTSAQSGSYEQCASLLRAFGVAQAPEEAHRVDGMGLGCHLYGGAPYWLTTPDFSVTARSLGARLLCACVR
jgi:hypothetical protein